MALVESNLRLLGVNEARCFWVEKLITFIIHNKTRKYSLKIIPLL